MASPDATQTWTSLELIVLVRGTPEERVLGACKATPIHGPSSNDTECFDSASPCTECVNESFS